MSFLTGMDNETKLFVVLIVCTALTACVGFICLAAVEIAKVTHAAG